MDFLLYIVLVSVIVVMFVLLYRQQRRLLELESHQQTWEKKIREDAIAKSKSVIRGQATEHLIPFFATSFPFNPKEARFIGSPIDLIIFHGIDDPDAGDNVAIYFVEIKTGSSALSKREKLIKQAVQAGRVHWEEIKIK